MAKVVRSGDPLCLVLAYRGYAPCRRS